MNYENLLKMSSGVYGLFLYHRDFNLLVWYRKM